jgi:hypothetical protein
LAQDVLLSKHMAATSAAPACKQRRRLGVVVIAVMSEVAFLMVCAFMLTPHF